MKSYHKKGDKVNMCGAIAALVAEGEMKGIEKGIDRGIRVLIETCRELAVSREDTFTKIRDKFDMADEETEMFMDKYWNEP